MEGLKSGWLGIKISPQLRDKIKEQTARQGFASYSEYVRTLIREDLKRSGY